MTKVELVALLVKNVSLAPVGNPVRESETEPLKPLAGVMVTGNVPPVPRANVNELLVEIVNAAAPGTVKLNVPIVVVPRVIGIA